MPGVPDFIAQSSFIWIALFLSVVVFFRSQGTYWIARLVTTGFLSSAQHSQRPWVIRLRRWLEGASVQRGMDAVDRWGLIVIPLSFLTIGFQTVVHAGSGVLRLRWPVYTAVAVPGYVAWGMLYAAIGVGLFKTGHALAAGKTWALTASTVFVIMLSIFVIMHRTRVARERVKATESTI